MSESSDLLLHTPAVASEPEQFLASVGEIFARFGPATQDSGNLSFGVEVDGQRFFVKSTDPNAAVYLDFADRVALLRNAIELRRRCAHALLPALLNVIESPSGPLLVYQWVNGELLRAVPGDAHSAHERFRQLPATEKLPALDGLFELHVHLADLGYVAADFYDGCLIYDFDAGALHVVDLDHYQSGPLRNEMGRMFGSSRFMAPEEFELGAQIDERTTVFNLGRAAAIFASDSGSDALAAVIARACQEDARNRFPSVAAFNTAWLDAR